MKRLKRAAIVLSLLESLRENNSWCGETNIQKATYFLQELVKVPLDLEFVLYKYGPYSFDLTDELTALRADSMLELEIRDPRFGPRYVLGQMGGFVMKRFPKTVSRYVRQVDFVAAKLGDKGVAELECLATALYVWLKGESKPAVKERVGEIVRLKPHIGKVKAEQAVTEVEKMFEEAKLLVEN